MLTQARGTANMVQAPRDFFGAHGFERVDQDGTGQHGPWADPTPEHLAPQMGITGKQPLQFGKATVERARAWQ